jgi:hypothetical protein
MAATLQPASDLGITESIRIVVKKGAIAKVHKLVTPTRIIEGGVKNSLNPLVATIQVDYPDGRTAKLFVRWMGKNPAAVSFDDEKYYWGDGGGDCGDGAVELIRVLSADP